jgi:hypothetical protein
MPQRYVLGATEGEHLVHFRDSGNIFIKSIPPRGPPISLWGRSRCPLAQAFQYTGTFRWTKPSTSLKEAELSC